MLGFLHPLSRVLFVVPYGSTRMYHKIVPGILACEWHTVDEGRYTRTRCHRFLVSGGWRQLKTRRPFRCNPTSVPTTTLPPPPLSRVRPCPFLPRQSAQQGREGFVRSGCHRRFWGIGSRYNRWQRHFRSEGGRLQ